MGFFKLKDKKEKVNLKLGYPIDDFIKHWFWRDIVWLQFGRE